MGLSFHKACREVTKIAESYNMSVIGIDNNGRSNHANIIILRKDNQKYVFRLHRGNISDNPNYWHNMRAEIRRFANQR